MSNLPEIKVTIFSDYICPFCYVGYHRLMRLKDKYDLKINWCFLEIHPENSAEGEPVTDLDYSSDFWDELMKNLKHLAEKENIQAEATITGIIIGAIVFTPSGKAVTRATGKRAAAKIFSG